MFFQSSIIPSVDITTPMIFLSKCFLRTGQVVGSVRVTRAEETLTVRCTTDVAFLHRLINSHLDPLSYSFAYFSHHGRVFLHASLQLHVNLKVTGTVNKSDHHWFHIEADHISEELTFFKQEHPWKTGPYADFQKGGFNKNGNTSEGGRVEK